MRVRTKNGEEVVVDLRDTNQLIKRKKDGWYIVIIDESKNLVYDVQISEQSNRFLQKWFQETH